MTGNNFTIGNNSNGSSENNNDNHNIDNDSKRFIDCSKTNMWVVI